MNPSDESRIFEFYERVYMLNKNPLMKIKYMFAAAMLILAGCSGGGAMPLSPDAGMPSSPLVDRQPESSHSLWGMWNFTLDINAMKIVPVPVRGTMAHYDVTDYLTPPACDNCLAVEALEFIPAEKYLKIQVILTNETPVSACDVRGILLPQSENVQLLNPDSYTGLWDDGGDITLNPFKAFATDQPSRIFAAGNSHAAVYELRFSKFNELLTLPFAIDVSWPGNCREPYEVSGITQLESIESLGGSTEVWINVYDWQFDAQDVSIDATPIGGDIVEFTYDSDTLWRATVETDQYNTGGDYRMLISAGSAGTALKLYNYIDFNIAPCFPEGNEIWQDATPLALGDNTGSQVVCADDKADWYKFVFYEHLYGEARFVYESDFGHSDMTLYGSDPDAGFIKWKQAFYPDDIVMDLGALDLDPGVYHLRIRHLDEDMDIRQYTLYLSATDSPCFPDGNDDYETALNLVSGSGSGQQYVCETDPEDWYIFDYSGAEGEMLKLEILNATGPAQLTLYTSAQALDPEGANIAQADADPTTAFDLYALGLSSDTYYARVRNTGANPDEREYRVSLGQGSGWAESWGGSGDDEPLAMATDPLGNIYIAGNFDSSSADFDPGPGVSNLAAVGGTDVFFAKYTAAGDLAWAYSIGGPGDEAACDIAVGQAGNVYVAGYFDSPVDFDPGPGNVGLEPEAGRDAWACKFTNSGALTWAAAFNSPSDSRATGIFPDNAGNACITGYFASSVDLDPGAGEQSVSAAAMDDVFAVKLNTSGAYMWGKSWGGTFNDRSEDIVLDGSGNLFIVGSFAGIVDFNPGTSEYILHGGLTDDAPYAFMCSLNPSGEFRGARSWGGSGVNRALGIARDGIAYVYVVGTCGVAGGGLIDIDPGPGVDQQASGTVSNFIIKLELDGDYAWGRIFGESGVAAMGVAVSGASVYTCGDGGSGDYDPGPDIDNHDAGVFLTKFDTSGNYQWTRTWCNDQGYDLASAVAASASEAAYVVGRFDSSADFDPGPAVFELIPSSADIFLAKFLPDGYW